MLVQKLVPDCPLLPQLTCLPELESSILESESNHLELITTRGLHVFWSSSQQIPCLYSLKWDNSHMHDFGLEYDGFSNLGYIWHINLCLMSKWVHLHILGMESRRSKPGGFKHQCCLWLQCSHDVNQCCQVSTMLDILVACHLQLLINVTIIAANCLHTYASVSFADGTQ